MDLQSLCSVLQACLSTDTAQRQAAEQALKQLDTAPGQCANLLRVAAEGSVDGAVRHIAAISFKNLVKRSWDPADKEAWRMSPEDKALVRENLLEALIRAPHAIQAQLGESLKTIVYNDYPHEYPSLLPALTSNLAMQDAQRIHGALYALRLTVRKYEFRDEDERAPLAELINTTFPLLLHIFQQLLSSPLTPDVCTYTRLVFKTFWSATYMGVPDKLLEPAQFQGWMTAFLTSLQQDLPEDQQPHDREERASSPYWKSRKWLYHILYRLVSRYANPKHCKEGNDQQFSRLLQGNVLNTFLDCILTKVASIATGKYVSPRVTNLIFQYLNYAINNKDMYKRVGANWDEILANVAFPLTCFNDEDATLWVEDPHEYIRKGYDILEDMYSPKTAAANFAHDLCGKKKAHLDRFLGSMVGVLSQFHTAAAAGGGRTDPALACRMDGALLAVGVLSDLLKGKKPYKNQLGSMLMNFVVPCFTSPYGHLRAKAVWVAGTYADVEFPDGTGEGVNFNSLFEKTVALLADPELPVRVDTVIALRNFIDAAEDTDSLKPVLPTLLNHIFHLMNEIDAEDLVFSLESLVEKFGQDIAPYAAQMVQQLAMAFDKYTQDKDDDDDDAEDMSGLAAYGVMRAINTLLESVCGLGTELFPVLEQALFPLIHKLISTDGQEVIEEVLEMLAYLTFFGPGISPRLWSLWPRMHNMLMEWGIDYWENLLVPLDNMISRDTETFLNSKDPDYLTSAFQMVQHSLTGDYADRDVVCAVRLWEVILQACRGRVDAWVQPYLGVALQRLARTTEHRGLMDALVLLVADALYYNPVLALQALGSLGALQTFFGAWFAMIMDSKKGGNKMKHFRRLQDKKVCALGLISLLSVPDEATPPGVQASRGLLLVGIVRVLTAMKEQEEDIKKAQQEEEEEGEDEEGEEGGEGAGEDGQEWGDDEEEVDDGGDAYLKRLEKAAKDLMGTGDDDDSDDEFTDDEEVQTPLDNIDAFVLLSDTLTSIAATQPAKSQALMAALSADPAAHANLQAAMAHADVKRQELAQKAAREAQ